MKILFQWNAFGSPGGFGCCPFLGGGSVVFIYCLMYFSWCVGILFVFVLVCNTLCPFYFCNRLEEEENAGSFAFVV